MVPLVWLPGGRVGGRVGGGIVAGEYGYSPTMMSVMAD